MLAVVAAAAVLAACGGRTSAPSGVPDPVANLAPAPAYPSFCAPSGVDVRATCLRLTLAALDSAGRRDRSAPLAVPATVADLPVPEQLFVVLDEERVARHLPPFVGLSAALDASAQRSADRGELPPPPAGGAADEEWVGGADNGLDAADQWLYDDGPGSGTQGCGGAGGRGCWADRHLVLDRFPGRGQLVMGAGFAPTADRDPGDVGGTSLAAVFARQVQPGPLAVTWAGVQPLLAGPRLAPLDRLPTHEATSGVPDPATNVAPVPDYVGLCAPTGLDGSDGCVAAVLAAVNHAHALEGVPAVTLPAGFGRLPVPEQLFVGVDLERVARGLPPAVGMTSALDADAAAGARRATDPPFPAGSRYTVSDTEWAGGSVNGLDAVYGWMEQDGFGSGNLDCPRPGAPGCWGHRHGVLDDFGTAGVLQVGAALDATGDTSNGDRGGTSMTVVLAVDDGPPGPYVYTWAQAVAAGAGLVGGPG